MTGPASPSRDIPQQFRAMVRERPDQAVIRLESDAVSFARLDRDSDRVAAGLNALGIVPGDRVALYCINGVEFVQAYLGILKAGAVVVPINLLIAPPEVRFILDDAAVSTVIYHAAMGESLAAVRDLAGPQVRRYVAIGGALGKPEDIVFECWVDEESADGTAPSVATAELAAILYTSGTTGRPKGAMLTHDNLLANTASVRDALALRPGEDTLLVVLPMFHAFAATVGMLTPLLHGLTLAPVVRFDPELVSRTVAAAGATVFLGVPSMYGVLLRLPEERLADWRGVRFGVSGGAAMPVELMRRFEARFGWPILEGDGPTECSPVTCVNPPDGERKPGSVGLPVPGVAIAIFDDDAAPVPDGEIGEICVRGANVMKGYWNLPDATAETLFGEWLRTGDLGYLDEDGYLFMVDRKKDLIIVNGMNVYPRMVEEVLFAHDGVLEAAVVGEPHASHGEIVVAHVVPAPDAGLTAAELRRFCRERLGQHQCPRKFMLRETLPKNATGKVLKRELRVAGEVERGVVRDD